MFFRKSSLTPAELTYIKMPLCSCTSCEKQRNLLKEQIPNKRLFYIELLRNEYNENKEKSEIGQFVS